MVKYKHGFTGIHYITVLWVRKPCEQYLMRHNKNISYDPQTQAMRPCDDCGVWCPATNWCSLATNWCSLASFSGL